MHQAPSGKPALGSRGIVFSFCLFCFYFSPGLELCIAHWFYGSGEGILVPSSMEFLGI
jgi:hypothetical protein